MKITYAALTLALIALPVVAMANPSAAPAVEPTVSLTRADLMALLQAQIAETRAADARASAAEADAKIRAAFAPPAPPPPVTGPTGGGLTGSAPAAEPAK